MSDSPVLECRDLGKRFTQGELDVVVLKHIDLTIHAGERVAIMGASGSGKSTLLHLLGGLDEATTGKVLLDGVDIAGLSQRELGTLRNRALGFVYQFHHLLGEFTVLENVSMPLLISGDSVPLAEEKAKDILGRVGLQQRIAHKPGELSGGERQRAAIARALVTRPKCVLADEPTGNLDRKTADQIYRLMFELNEEFRISFLIVTHDSSLARQMGRVLYIEDGRFIDAGDRQIQTISAPAGNDEGNKLPALKEKQVT